MRYHFLAAVHGLCKHPDLVLALIFGHVGGQRRLVFLWSAAEQAEVEFFHLARFHLLVEDPQALRVFGGDHDTAGVAVDAVDERRRERLVRFGIIFAFFIQIVLHARHQRVKVIAFVLVHDHAGLFVEQQQIAVLIDDIELGRRLQKIIVLFLRRVKEFILNIERQLVALAQLVGDIAFFAVDFDTFFADIHIQHRLGHGLEALLQKLVQPLSRVVFSDHQCPHYLTAYLIIAHYRRFFKHTFRMRVYHDTG